MIPEKQDGEDEHEHRTDDPILEKRQPEHLGIGENFGYFLVAHLGQRRIHHENETRRDEEVCRSDCDRREECPGIGDEKVAGQDTCSHCDENPPREVTVQEGHPSCDRIVHTGVTERRSTAAQDSLYGGFVFPSSPNFRKSRRKTASSPA